MLASSVGPRTWRSNICQSISSRQHLQHCICIPSSAAMTLMNKRHRCIGRAAAELHVIATTSVPSGQLAIQLLTQDDIQGAGLLLTRSFAGSPEAVKLDGAIQFMQRHQAQATSCVTLVARLVPTDPALLPPNKSSRLVGCVSVSFDASSRDSFESLEPPSDEPYLSNMAVDVKVRRQGIGRAMLQACDEVVKARDHSSIWLHVRQADEAAQQLYGSYGYEEVDRDKPKISLFGVSSDKTRPRILMKRQLP